jgi:hypothetical protein
MSSINPCFCHKSEAEAKMMKRSKMFQHFYVIFKSENHTNSIIIYSLVPKLEILMKTEGERGPENFLAISF